MKQLRLIALSMFLLGLAGCQTFEGMMEDINSLNLPSLNNPVSISDNELVYSGRCPQVEAVEELKTLSLFNDLNDKSDDNLISHIDIKKIQNACNYDEHGVTIDLTMDFTGKLGPKGTESSSFSYPFFIAITSPNGDILAKEVFSVGLTYKIDQTEQVYIEKMRQIIPLDNIDNGPKYKVLVGFQLTPDQLSYNRNKIQEARIRESEEQKKMKLQKEAEQMNKQHQKEQLQKEIYIGRPLDIVQ